MNRVLCYLSNVANIVREAQKNRAYVLRFRETDDQAGLCKECGCRLIIIICGTEVSCKVGIIQITTIDMVHEKCFSLE